MTHATILNLGLHMQKIQCNIPIFAAGPWSNESSESFIIVDELRRVFAVHFKRCTRDLLSV